MRGVREQLGVQSAESGAASLHELVDGLIRLRPELGSLADELIVLLQGGSPVEHDDEQGLPDS